MTERNTNKRLWTVFGALVVLIVGLVVAIVVVANRPKQISPNDDADVTEGVETAYDVNDAAYDILYELKNNPEFTEGDAEQAFGELIESQTGDGKIYAVVAYADFVLEQTGDIERAATLMESIEDEVGYNLKAGFYITFSDLYRKAGMNDKAELYYNLAMELTKEYSNL